MVKMVIYFNLYIIFLFIIFFQTSPTEALKWLQNYNIYLLLLFTFLFIIIFFIIGLEMIKNYYFFILYLLLFNIF
jgi:hypothetical protein